MSNTGKAKVTVKIYYVFPPKGFETSPSQITRGQIQKYLSGKPLRLGPDRWAGDEPGGTGQKSNPRSQGEKRTDREAHD